MAREKRTSHIERMKIALGVELRSHRLIYILLIPIFAAATFFRVFRVDQVLGFYYDQGRDALVIADLLSKGKFFLIGPTTGIAGIFRGPFYYYLITPAYWLGGGDPTYPAVFLGLMSVVALVLLYYLAMKATDRTGGIIAAFLGSFSYYIIYASRWLSNPTPMLLLSLVLVWMMYLITKGKQWAWVVLSFVAGSSLFHFGSSGEFFYFPALLVFSLWQIGVFRRKIALPPISIILLSVVAFASTAAPLVIFDLRHERILTNNITKFFVGEGTFKSSIWEVAGARTQFFVDVFYSKIFHSKGTLEKLLMTGVLLLGLLKLRSLFKNTIVKISLLLFASPFIGLMFFQGNEGNIYDYYLTGYYLIFILLIAVCLRETWRLFPGKIIVLIFLFLFLKQNVPPSWSWIHDGVDGPTTIAFGNQKQALNWVFENAAGRNFNIDVYVPPVIPYTYTYLSSWYSNGLGKPGLVEGREDLLYTIYEVDPPHPERLEAWMKRQAGIATVLEEKSFGGITVQKRTRIK